MKNIRNFCVGLAVSATLVTSLILPVQAKGVKLPSCLNKMNKQSAQMTYVLASTKLNAGLIWMLVGKVDSGETDAHNPLTIALVDSLHDQLVLNADALIEIGKDDKANDIYNIVETIQLGVESVDNSVEYGGISFTTLASDGGNLVEFAQDAALAFKVNPCFEKTFDALSAEFFATSK